MTMKEIEKIIDEQINDMPDVSIVDLKFGDSFVSNKTKTHLRHDGDEWIYIAAAHTYFNEESGSKIRSGYLSVDCYTPGYQGKSKKYQVKWPSLPQKIRGPVSLEEDRYLCIMPLRYDLIIDIPYRQKVAKFALKHCFEWIQRKKIWCREKSEFINADIIESQDQY